MIQLLQQICITSRTVTGNTSNSQNDMDVGYTFSMQWEYQNFYGGNEWNSELNKINSNGTLWCRQVPACILNHWVPGKINKETMKTVTSEMFSEALVLGVRRGSFQKAEVLNWTQAAKPKYKNECVQSETKSIPKNTISCSLSQNIERCYPVACGIVTDTRSPCIRFCIGCRYLEHALLTSQSVGEPRVPLT